MSEKPLVTIMIPTYNQEEYISDAIESALAQTYENLEIIVSDDCSTDDTWEIIQSYDDSRLRKFKNQKNRGRIGNYRKLLYDLANGKFVIMNDGDDQLTDEAYIAQAMRLYNKYSKNILAFFANYKTIKNGVEYIKKLDLEKEILEGIDFVFRRDNHGFQFHQTLIYNRKEACELDFYKGDFLGSESLSIMKLFLGGYVGHIDHTVAVHKLVQTSVSGSTDFNKLKSRYIYPEQFVDYVKRKDFNVNNNLLEKWKTNRKYSNIKADLCKCLQENDLKNAYRILRYTFYNERKVLLRLLTSPSVYISYFGRLHYFLKIFHNYLKRKK